MFSFSKADHIAVVYPSVIGEIIFTSNEWEDKNITISPIEVEDYDVYLQEEQDKTILVLISTEGDMMAPDTLVDSFDGSGIMSNDIFCEMIFNSADGENELTVSSAGFVFSTKKATRINVYIHTNSRGVADAIGIEFLKTQ